MSTNEKAAGAVIVCERTGRIAALLRSKLPAGVPLVETRTVDECQQSLTDLPASLIIVEATAAVLDRWLRLLKLVSDRFPDAAAIVVADRSLKPVEPLLREAGAAHVTFGTREIEQIVRLALRHAQRFQHPTTLAEEIWERLPWAAR